MAFNTFKCNCLTPLDFKGLLTLYHHELLLLLLLLLLDNAKACYTNPALVSGSRAGCAVASYQWIINLLSFAAHSYNQIRIVIEYPVNSNAKELCTVKTTAICNGQLLTL